jgi:hypothetical protein
MAKRKRQGAAGDRPVRYDYDDCKGRNVIKRFFNRMKNWRGVASRFDGLAVVFRGGVILAAIVDWLRQRAKNGLSSAQGHRRADLQTDPRRTDRRASLRCEARPQLARMPPPRLPQLPGAVCLRFDTRRTDVARRLHPAAPSVRQDRHGRGF